MVYCRSYGTVCNLRREEERKNSRRERRGEERGKRGGEENRTEGGGKRGEEKKREGWRREVDTAVTGS